jgi:WD40 repeat protein
MSSPAPAASVLSRSVLASLAVSLDSPFPHSSRFTFSPSIDPDPNDLGLALRQKLSYHEDYSQWATSPPTESTAMTERARIAAPPIFSPSVPNLSTAASAPASSPVSWSLHRVLLGHSGWVRSLSVDPAGNEFIASASNDGSIKLWSLSSGSLLVTLDSHSGAVRSVLASARHPYLFSGGEDHLVKCWDLESNRVIRSYFGHGSGITALAIHPKLDLLISGSRDATCKLWDIRVNQAIQTLVGHTDTVNALAAQVNQPSLISGSSDSTVKCWDLASGRCIVTLTQHSKGVRALRFHSDSYSFASAGGEQVKVFQCPEAKFTRNIQGMENDSQTHRGFVRV